eukprot:RCo053646
MVLIGNNDQVYRINFSLGTFPGLHVVSEPITIQPCLPAARKYAVSCTTQCIRCPENAVCNGTSTLLVLPGFWRGSPTTMKIYPCVTVRSCNPNGPREVTECA